MSRNRRIVFVRHAQRLDRYIKEAYPGIKDWTQECFQGSEYRPINIEFPMNLPRQSSAARYLDDTPLTTMGEGCAMLMGNRLAEIGLQIDMAYSSPSTRCVQTCHRLLQGYSNLNGPNDIKIRIEGGLYEFGGFVHGPPTFLDPKFLYDRGIPIDLPYEPDIRKVEATLLSHAWEGFTEFRTRGLRCIDKILSTAGPNVETILIVTHAPSLLTFVRNLLKKPINEESLEHFSQPGNVMNKPAYIAAVMLEENRANRQWFLPLPQPLPSFEIRAHTTFSQNWLDKTTYESPVV